MRLSLCLPLAVSALAAGSSPPSWAPDHRSTEGSRRITHVWAVRHGQAWHNLDRQNGWRLPDPGLTALGWEQATAAAGLLPHNLSLLISSPLRRCVQTTAAALTALGAPPPAAASGRRVPLVLHPDLQEIYFGPADTGRPWHELLAEFGAQDEGSSEVPLPLGAAGRPRAQGAPGVVPREGAPAAGADCAEEAGQAGLRQAAGTEVPGLARIDLILGWERWPWPAAVPAA